MRLSRSKPAQRVRQAQRKRRRIDRLYDSLDDRVDLLTEEPDLQDAILDWQDDADEAPSASLLDHIEATLTTFETQYEMRRIDLDGTDEFPDDCEECEHYGVACPLFHNRAERIERDRLQEALVGASEEEVKQAYRQLAGRVGCQVIVVEIEDWVEKYSSLLDRGRDLRRQSNHVLRPQDDREAAAEVAADSLDGVGGGT